MPMHLLRTALLLAGVLAFVAGLSRADKTPLLGADRGAARYFGVETCYRCHTLPTGTDTTEFVLLTECTTWLVKDKHALAYLALEGPRGKQIGNILKMDVTKAETGCLNCHALDQPLDRWVVRGGKPEEKRTRSLRDGVQCEVCHGAAEHWLDKHIRDEEWRRTSGKDKEKLGMFNLRDPARRAELCLSCHIGNAAQGKVVTHAMFAAGHPPLPPFELASFCERMQRHWRFKRDVPYLKDPPADIKKEIDANYGLDTKAYENSQALIAGSFTALHASAELMRDRATVDAKTDRLRRWPELAMTQFGASDSVAERWPEIALAHSDCYACHHELTSPSWRQQRGYHGRLGRPQMRVWPLALLEPTLTAAEPPMSGQIAVLQSLLRDVYRAADERPFGEPAKVAQLAERLRNWTNEQRTQAAFSRPVVHQPQMLHALCAAGLRGYPDAESAEQLVAALAVIYDEWRPKSGNDDPIKSILDGLRLRYTPQAATTDERILLVLKQLGVGDEARTSPGQLAEAVRAKVNRLADPAFRSDAFLSGIQALSDRETASRLEHLRTYDPRALQDELRKLQALLPAR